jgi:hypothetical protein
MKSIAVGMPPPFPKSVPKGSCELGSSPPLPLGSFPLIVVV